jgi:hypothetical protein
MLSAFANRLRPKADFSGQEASADTRRARFSPAEALAKAGEM